MPLTANVVANTPIEASWGNAIRDRTVQRFTSAAERASAWTSPPAGAVSEIDTLPGVLWIYVSGAWRMASPRGMVGQSAPVTASSPTTTGAAVDVPNMTAAFAMVTGHLYKITVTGHYLSSALGDVIRMSITNPANTLVGGASDLVVAAANIAHAFSMHVFETGSSDATATRKLRVARNSGSGNAGFFADASRLGMVTVEEVHVGTSGG